MSKADQFTKDAADLAANYRFWTHDFDTKLLSKRANATIYFADREFDVLEIGRE